MMTLTGNQVSMSHLGFPIPGWVAGTDANPGFERPSVLRTVSGVQSCWKPGFQPCGHRADCFCSGPRVTPHSLGLKQRLGDGASPRAAWSSGMRALAPCRMVVDCRHPLERSRLETRFPQRNYTHGQHP